MTGYSQYQLNETGAGIHPDLGIDMLDVGSHGVRAGSQLVCRLLLQQRRDLGLGRRQPIGALQYHGFPVNRGT